MTKKKKNKSEIGKKIMVWFLLFVMVGSFFASIAAYLLYLK